MEKIVTDLINSLGLNDEMHYCEVKKKIYTYIKEKYCSKMSIAAIKLWVGELAERVFIKLSLDEEEKLLTNKLL